MADRPRLRFAPSPTGFLHVGGARTALFNWLYARRYGGVFVLRIEDTDAERSSEDRVTGILDGLRWLGLDWDEGPGAGGPYGPYFQSERLDRYRAKAEALVAHGHAYYCYCRPEELKQKREAAQARGEAGTYDRACRRRPPEQVAALEQSGTPRAVRFAVADGSTRFDDLVHGLIEVDHRTIEDFVVLRSDTHPTYHLSVVVDDLDMAITHVVRGDDHISNTPKQLLLYAAFGATPPRFAHVPLILGADKKRLSKRHGATSVTEYQQQGYLPDAMVNFLALLGWSPGDDREVFTRDALTREFTLDGISGGNAVFNPEKLDWFNGQHVTLMPAEAIATRIEPRLREAGLWRDAYADADRAWLLGVIDLLKSRVRLLADFVEYGRPFFTDTFEYDPVAVKKRLSAPDLGAHVAALRETLASVTPFEHAALDLAVRGLAEQREIKAGVLIHAIRVALTGTMVGAGLFEILELFGRQRTLARLERLAEFLAERTG